MGNKAPSPSLRILLPSQESRALSSLLCPPGPQSNTCWVQQKSPYYQRVNHLITVPGLAPSDTITRLWMVHVPGFTISPAGISFTSTPQLTQFLFTGPHVHFLPTLSNLHCGCAQSLSHVWLCVTPWPVAHQAPLSMGFYRQECIPFSRGHSWPRDQPQVSCIAGEFFTDRATWSQLPEINYFSLPWTAPHSSLSFFLWKKVQQWCFMETPVSSLILSPLFNV